MTLSLAKVTGRDNNGSAVMRRMVDGKPEQVILSTGGSQPKTGAWVLIEHLYRRADTCQGAHVWYPAPSSRIEAEKDSFPESLR